MAGKKLPLDILTDKIEIDPENALSRMSSGDQVFYTSTSGDGVYDSTQEPMGKDKNRKFYITPPIMTNEEPPASVENDPITGLPVTLGTVASTLWVPGAAMPLVGGAAALGLLDLARNFAKQQGATLEDPKTKEYMIRQAFKGMGPITLKKAMGDTKFEDLVNLPTEELATKLESVKPEQKAVKDLSAEDIYKSYLNKWYKQQTENKEFGLKDIATALGAMAGDQYGAKGLESTPTSQFLGNLGSFAKGFAGAQGSNNIDIDSLVKLASMYKDTKANNSTVTAYWNRLNNSAWVKAAAAMTKFDTAKILEKNPNADVNSILITEINKQKIDPQDVADAAAYIANEQFTSAGYDPLISKASIDRGRDIFMKVVLPGGKSDANKEYEEIADRSKLKVGEDVYIPSLKGGYIITKYDPKLSKVYKKK